MRALRRSSALRRRYGHSVDAEGSRVQSLLFRKDRFSLAQAQAWARRHNWKTNDVDSTEEFIHLRQDDPRKFDRVRTIYMGGSGVQARVGFPR